jgi:hypothetical protein
MRVSKNEAAELALSRLVDALASALIQLDITPGRLGEIAKASFVRAGAAIATKKRSDRPHIARVAAITGLTRSEVKRIVEENYSPGPLRPETAPRALRVLAAWRTAKGYSSNSKPRQLPLAGAYPSFESLCKEFSGDIPHKAIVTELAARKMIRVGRANGKLCVSIVRRKAQKDSPILDTLLYAASIIQAIGNANATLVRKRVRVGAIKNLAPEYVEKTVANRVNTLVDALPTAFGRPSKGSKQAEGLEVFAIVVRRSGGL